VEELARPRLGALPLALVIALAAAPAASAADPHVASSVRADGTTVIRYVAPRGQDNEVTMRVRAEELDPYKRQRGLREDTGIDFYDIGADGITASGPGCNPQGTGVGCDVKGTKVEVHVALGDGNDEILPQYDPARLVPATINGGPGNDILSVFGPAPTALDFSGGTGTDAIDYFSRTNAPYSFTEDALFNDGLGHDRIHNDVEAWVGGDGNDRFVLTARKQHVVFGAGGDDTMVSGPGPDEFDGGYGGDPSGVDSPSNDTVTYAGRTTGVTVTLDGLPDDGAPGEGDEILPTVEHVVGTAFADTLVGPAHVPDGRPYTLEGGGGDDVLSGGTGTDFIDAGSGNDTVIALGGGTDGVKCGPGNDVLVADTSDRTRTPSDCEQVWRSYLKAPPIEHGSAVVAGLAVAAPNTTVSATLESASGTVGSGKFSSVAGLRQLTVALDAAGKQALQQAGALPLTLKVRMTSPGRKAITTSAKVTLAKKG
jgi:Ca2+-binding RTX toxin-like protein